ncbi:right-handed parallel beta-helix repeat-containing protein [Vibrio sp. PP-XX7]
MILEGGQLMGVVGTEKPLFNCNKQSNVTIKNVTIKNSPRYALFIRSCNGLKISNFTMKDMSKSTGGIRFDKGYASSNVTLSSIKASDVGGHAVELWDVDGYSIDSVDASRTTGCGLLVNRSKNGQIGTVTGDRNAQGGGYATLRFANDNGKVSVKKVEITKFRAGILQCEWES